MHTSYHIMFFISKKIPPGDICVIEETDVVNEWLPLCSFVEMTRARDRSRLDCKLQL